MKTNLSVRNTALPPMSTQHGSVGLIFRAYRVSRSSTNRLCPHV